MANPEVWLWIILAYYFVATFISIDKIIGRIYPIFGICLIVMAIGVIIGIFTNPSYTIPEIWSHFTNMHPDGKTNLELHVYYRSMWSNFRIPFYTVTTDGTLYEI